MKWLIAIPLILFGSFLLALTIDSYEFIGNIILDIVGVGFLCLGGLVGRKKKEKQLPN